MNYRRIREIEARLRRRTTIATSQPREIDLEFPVNQDGAANNLEAVLGVVTLDLSSYYFASIEDPRLERRIVENEVVRYEEEITEFKFTPSTKVLVFYVVDGFTGRIKLALNK